MKYANKVMLIVAVATLVMASYGMVSPVYAEGTGKSVAQQNPTIHRSVSIDGVEIF